MNRYSCGAIGFGAGLLVGWATQPPLQPVEPLHRSSERAMHVLFFGVIGLSAGVAIGLMLEHRAVRSAGWSR